MFSQYHARQMGDKTVRMTREAFEKWMTALRSGEYKQSTGLLAKPVNGGTGYCCLGVMEHCLTGEVEVDDTGNIEELPSLDWLRTHNVSFAGMSSKEDNPFNSEVPSVYVTAEDVESIGGNYVEEGWHEVSELNDNNVSFESIATMLERHVEFID